MGHTLRLLPSSPYPSHRFICNLCCEPGCGPVYHCSSDCDFDLHVSCSAVTSLHTHFTHPHHPLLLTLNDSRRRTCNSCGSGIRTAWSFRCDPCDFDIHSVCARAPRFILHPEHPHVLELLKSATAPTASVHCSGCRRVVSHHYYSCRICSFYLHQACAALPDKIKDARHQAHMLTVVYSSPRDKLRCKECVGLIEGWYFQCATCNFNLHPFCAEIIHELPHDDMATQETNNIATTSANASTAHNGVHSVTACSISHVPSHVNVPNSQDFDAVKRVLRFAEEMMKANGLSHTAGSPGLDHRDSLFDFCPTCLEGFEPTNPKKVTSCGHYFHMACIMDWMERSSSCPICRGHLTIVG